MNNNNGNKGKESDIITKKGFLISLPGKKKEIEVLIPYSDSKTSATLHDGEVILSESYEAEGTKIRVMADEALYARLRQYIIE